MPGLDPCQTIRELLATMHTLRAPGGCPWDAAQTAESLTPYLLEEACEAIDAIETGSAAMIADELGDLLLQIVFQAEIFSERHLFDFADVAAGINTKLIRRHPHVFSGVNAPIPLDELARQWERIKRAEQPVSSQPPHPLGQLPGSLPSLQRAQKLLAKGERAGLDLERYLPALSAGPPADEEELGRALLALVKQAELSGLDAEQALRRTVRKLCNAIASEHAEINEPQ
jgi:XTP/dITP diphosphohydrolase